MTNGIFEPFLRGQEARRQFDVNALRRDIQQGAQQGLRPTQQQLGQLGALDTATATNVVI